MNVDNVIFNSITNGHEITKSPYKLSNGEYLYWCDALGIGYLKSHASDDEVYDIDYWEKYQKMTDTPMGRDLTKARYDLVAKYISPNSVLDMGIGSGQFVIAADCYGYDVNKHAIDWLINTNRYHDYNSGKKFNITQFDVLEHIDNPSDIFENVDEYFIMSTPIYKDMNYCLNSKHLKVNEHIWYFTPSGVLSYLEYFGFKCLEISNIESKLGRQDIMSFVFKRR